MLLKRLLQKESHFLCRIANFNKSFSFKPFLSVHFFNISATRFPRIQIFFTIFPGFPRLSFRFLLFLIAFFLFLPVPANPSCLTLLR